MTSYSQQLYVTSQELTYLLGSHAPRATCCLHWLSLCYTGANHPLCSFSRLRHSLYQLVQ